MFNFGEDLCNHPEMKNFPLTGYSETDFSKITSTGRCIQPKGYCCQIPNTETVGYALPFLSKKGKPLSNKK